MTHSEPSGISTHNEYISQTYTFVVLIFPFDVVVHRHEDNSPLEMFWFTTQVLHFFYPSHDLQRSVSLEYHPLELNWFSIDSIEFSVLSGALNPFQSVLSFNARLWEFSRISNEQYRV